MLSIRTDISLIAVAAALIAAEGRAQEPDTTGLARVRAQIEALTRDIEQLKLGQELVVEADTGMMGFGPAASKVYQVRQGVSVGGYGEVVYERFAATGENGAPSGRTDQLDALRGILYVGYKFTDRLLFNSEIEIEHANEVGLEFAYVDYRLSESVGVRGGLLLVPMGFLNELHEPPIFLGTVRPAVEQQIIPSTWRENGIGIFGGAGGLAYRAYVVNGLRGAGFNASGLRGGRQKGSRALAEDFALVGRLDYTGVLGLLIGMSAYLGGSGQNAVSVINPAQTIGARTVIWDVHAEYKAYGLDLRGLFVRATLDDVGELNALNGLAGTASIGERLTGWYLQGGYDVLRRARTGHQLVPYVRYERLDTQDRVPAGFAANPANDRRIMAVGAAWKPITSVVLKADYQVHRNAATTGVNQMNVQVGYLF